MFIRVMIKINVVRFKIKNEIILLKNSSKFNRVEAMFKPIEVKFNLNKIIFKE